MSEEYNDDILDKDIVEIGSEEVEIIDPIKISRFDKLTDIPKEELKHKLTGMFKEWFLDYASYVILERAVPHLNDGLKPVQRRLLHAMKKNDDGRYNKVASIIGETMKFHPHGDSSIGGALVQLGQKDLLIDCQGNWGNILTGDSAAAPRYIEARLTPFAKDVLFNYKTTELTPSYDGRNQEPVTLPAKFPLLLAQGCEGIAVGLASKVLPHNFNELIDASIACLRGKEFDLYPDFQTGGMIDVSRYGEGLRGSAVRIRAKITKNSTHSLTITEVPYGKTTPIIIDSILRANEKGKIKIKKVDDNTAENAEINITLSTDVSADKTIDALYAFTDCEVSISPNSCVISENHPHFLGVKDILRRSAEQTMALLKLELEIRLNELYDDWHNSSLEKIFIENKIYLTIENCTSYEAVLTTIDKELDPYKPRLRREVSKEDIVRLTEIRIKRTAKYNKFEADDHLKGVEAEIAKTLGNIEDIVNFTVNYYNEIKRKYGKGRDRRSEIRSFGTIDASKVAVANAKLYVNKEQGFFGIGNSMKGDEYVCDCSDIDDVIVFTKEGRYIITKVSEKAFFEKDIYYIGVFKRNDDRTIYNVLYRDGLKGAIIMKRCAIKGITRDKEYDITKGSPKSFLLHMSVNPNGEAEILKIYFRPRPRLKKAIVDLDFSTISIKNRQSQGNLFTRYAISKIILKERGVSTLGGKDVWFDHDIKRLNNDGNGQILGNFIGDDKTIVFTKTNFYYTTGYDCSTYFPDDLIRIEKHDAEKVYSAVYYDATQKYYYLKRFNCEESEKMQKFIDDEDGSKLIALSIDEYPQLKITFEGVNASRPEELIDAEDFIGVKSHKAKGKRLTTYQVGEIVFTKPLEKVKEIEEIEDIEDTEDLIEDMDSESFDAEITDISEREKEIEIKHNIQGELF